ncbi:MAG: AtpZ/AtpI family protein [Clostridioides difficile]|nr:AtpZ/AtpI family protein [Clostridioides sp.]MBS5788367.1 AtpZ/AtpI family protein [Clostridioides difficile]
MDGKKRREILRALSLITQLGLTIVVCIVGCTLVGRFLDAKFDTSPILTIIFLILGVGGAFSSSYKTLIVFTKRK